MTITSENVVRSPMVDPRADVLLQPATTRPRQVSRRVALAAGCGALALVAGHILAIGKGTASAGLWMILDRGFDLGLTSGLFLLGHALGRRLLRRLGVGDDVDATAIGLGTLGMLTFGLGLIGLFQPAILMTSLGLVAAWCRHELIETCAQLARWLEAPIASVRRLAPGGMALGRSIGLVVASLVLLALFRALTPSIEADAVTYHLNLPKRYLEHGRFLPLPYGGDGFPFTTEMLYVLVLAVRSEIAPRLIHLGLTGLTALAILRFVAAREGQLAGRLAALVFLTLPATLVVGSWAYNDLASTCFQVLAVQALLTWTETKDRRWLVLAGVQTGFGLGVKLLALHLLVVTPIVVGWTLRHTPRRAAAALALYYLTAATVAAPWYVKNWLWYGHPLYPMAATVEAVVLWGKVPDVVLTSGVSITPGVGDAPLNRLLLPVNVFLHSDAFTNGHAPTVFGPLLLLTPLALFVPTTATTRRTMLIVAVLFALWGRGYQEARYFFPGATLAAAVAGVVLARLLERYAHGRVLQRAIGITGLVVGLAVAFDQGEMTLTRADLLHGGRAWAPPFAFLLGLESRDQFLAERYPDFAALQYVNRATPPDAGILFLGTWAGSYYTDRPFLPGNLLDLEWLVPTPHGYRYWRQDGGAGAPAYAPTFVDALAAMRAEGVTHLYVGKIVVSQVGRPNEALARLYDDLQHAVDAGALRIVYWDRYAAVLQITTGASR